MSGLSALPWIAVTVADLQNAQAGALVTAFQGTASATPDAQENLAGLLNLLGAPRGPGVVSLDFSH